MEVLLPTKVDFVIDTPENFEGDMSQVKVIYAEDPKTGKELDIEELSKRIGTEKEQEFERLVYRDVLRRKTTE